MTILLNLEASDKRTITNHEYLLATFKIDGEIKMLGYVQDAGATPSIYVKEHLNEHKQYLKLYSNRKEVIDEIIKELGDREAYSWFTDYMFDIVKEHVSEDVLNTFKDKIIDTKEYVCKILSIENVKDVPMQIVLDRCGVDEDIEISHTPFHFSPITTVEYSKQELGVLENLLNSVKGNR